MVIEKFERHGIIDNYFLNFKSRAASSQQSCGCSQKKQNFIGVLLFGYLHCSDEFNFKK